MWSTYYIIYYCALKSIIFFSLIVRCDFLRGDDIDVGIVGKIKSVGKLWSFGKLVNKNRWTFFVYKIPLTEIFSNIPRVLL